MLCLFFATLIIDLWPGAKTSPRYVRRVAQWEKRHLSGAEHALSHAVGTQAVSGEPQDIRDEEVFPSYLQNQTAGPASRPVSSSAELFNSPSDKAYDHRSSYVADPVAPRKGHLL